ncbi:hypothetical protein G6N82_01385 [Altererythrobacter sp. BO-6]|uniref:hypothetical protein n=1 Tax=Altererythrobacter sp. BO-6 TaxID=2604537 RepID=UPI0013E180EB|nr:hypothetical protein [Altererythrobacter sp. BO-6]QIG52751.1 hypothetical protein G6N82_01385 [Altererythrobacter sp. BO-6]
MELEVAQAAVLGDDRKINRMARRTAQIGDAQICSSTHGHKPPQNALVTGNDGERLIFGKDELAKNGAIQPITGKLAAP